jgi:valyl-tRNA synthetase
VVTRVKKQLKDVDQEAARLSAKLGNPSFKDKAPPEVIEEHERRLHTIRNEIAILQDTDRQLDDMMRSRTR